MTSCTGTGRKTAPILKAFTAFPKDETSAEKLLPKTSAKSSSPRCSTVKNSPEEKPLSAREPQTKESPRAKNIRIITAERERKNALLKSAVKTTAFLKRSIGGFRAVYSVSSETSAFPKSSAEYFASSRVLPVAPISMSKSPGERSMLYLR